MNHWVMDYETMANCFVAVFEHYKTNETKVFVIHEKTNDFNDFITFLEKNISNKERHISYNGLGFDAQITEYMLAAKDEWSEYNAKEITYEVYKLAQHVINKQSSREWLDYYEYNMQIPQLDVFKLNHWDNAAKRSSLKWIQFSMRWENLQDMPLHHGDPIYKKEDLENLIDYCINDVKSTKEIFKKSIDQIKLRKSLTKEYKINLYNASEPKISKELFLYFLTKKTGWKKTDIKYSSTQRSTIDVSKILLPYIKFNNKQLIELLDKFKSKIIDPSKTKGGFNASIKFHGVKTDFGLGGIHGARSSGVYKTNKDMMIMSSDVTSFYPNLAIRNKWSPAHLPKEAFCEQYEWFFDERVKIPKSDIRNYVYKIILNSTYGLSNDKYSFLYDPQFTMQITINGQLSLLMLYEMIMDKIPGSIPLMQNTDGLETLIPKKYKEKYLEICKEWEDITSLNLEHDSYRQLILADVNNYIAVHDWKRVERDEYNKLKENPHNLIKQEKGNFYHSKVKCKGRFEFQNLPLHKNPSNLIVPQALYHYFLNDVTPEKYIENNNNIFDYCIGKKIKGNWKFEKRWIDKEYKTEDLQKTIRYYVSNQGCKIVKVNKGDGREIQTDSGKWLLTLFNTYEEKEWSKYNINDKYYLNSIYTEIENIAGPKTKQIKLF